MFTGSVTLEDPIMNKLIEIRLFMRAIAKSNKPEFMDVYQEYDSTRFIREGSVFKKDYRGA